MNCVTRRLLVCYQVKCHHYWPSEGSRLYGVILVELIEEVSFGDYISRKFKLTHTEVCHNVIETLARIAYTDIFSETADLLRFSYIWPTCISLSTLCFLQRKMSVCLSIYLSVCLFVFLLALFSLF